MGFIDENGYPLINEEQKIRIALSNRARLTMAEDMDVFGTPKAATFVNTVFANYKSEAKSSISLYLQQREIELDMSKEDLEQLALADETIQAEISGKTVRKIIAIPNRLVNIVAN